uniref:Retrotransposon protein, putative, unclassified n=1 Tax=Oryza sativa subsp. japonica TaxID=39947 RepID=Q33A55_ORYSJ|nr:retrotransposon protein, putative, unclassified [Oryza sativa Japonica Group]
MDLDKSTSTGASLKKLQEDGALPSHETMERELGGIEPEPILGRMVAVEDYILCGFLPLPSEFLLLVLNFYGLSLLHLNPNSIAFLSIFSDLCEAYIGVEPFLDLFHFYYELRWMEPKKIENSDPVFVVPEEQPDKISSWTTKPALAPSLQSFIDIIDGLRIRGLSGYEVAADFIGLNSETVERRVGQVMINGPTTASNVPIPLCEKGTAEREAAINDRIVIHVVQALPLTDVIGPLVDHQAAASLKEGVTQEVSDVAAAAAAATTSGSNIPKKGRKFSSVVCNRRKAPTPSAVLMAITAILHRAARAKAAQDGSGGNSSASLAAASTEVVVVPKSREATPSGSVGGLVPARGPLADILTWGELQIEMERILQAGARRIGREIEEAKAVVSSSVNERAKLARDLAEVHEDLQKMRELVVGNEQQRQGLEQHMSELENNLSEIRGSLWTTYTGLNQLAVECGVTTTIPANPDEFSLMTSLAKLATAMEEIPSKHAARIGEETSNGIYIGACHVLSCVRLAHPELDLQRILDQGAANDAHLESALADRDRRIQYWRTKFEVAELERTMVEVKKDRAVEALRGREVWFNSYLRSCCAVMAGVSRELQVPRGDPEESAAGYISWLNGACAQLEGIDKHIDEALKQECRR